MQRFKRQWTIGLIAIMVLVSTIALVKPAPAQSELSGHLLAIAQQELQAENNTLISGNTPSDAIEQHIRSSQFRTNVQSRLNGIVQQHKLNQKSQHPYINAETTLEPLSFEIDRTGVTATLVARESTKLYLDRGTDPDTPEYTASELTHTFTFFLENGEWHLENDQVPDVTNLDAPVPSPVDAAPIPASDSTPPESLLNGSNSPNELRGPQADARYSTYRAALVSYAYAYWNNYNPAYHSYSDDCTNFGSQALRAGGWQFIGGYYTLNSVWWYTGGAFGFIPPYASYTWTGASNLNQFMWSQYGNRAILQSNVANLQPGDILIANWNRDNVHFHTMIVTKRDSSGELYITEHTNNNRDKKFFGTILPQNPNTNWYPWSIAGSFTQ